MTHQYCAGLCSRANGGPYRLFGVEAGNRCWCGDAVKAGAEQLNETSCDRPCAGNRTQMCGSGGNAWTWKVGVFEVDCGPVIGGPAVHVAGAAAGGRPLASAGVSDRIVIGAWNILRVLAEPRRVRVWLNPTFADVTGSSVPPADSAAAPHAPAPIIDARTDAAAAPAGLRATAQGGAWRIDYASVLPPTLFSA